LGKTNEAVSEAQTVVHLNPRFPNAHITLARVFERKGKTEAAISEYKEAVRIVPNLAKAYYNLGALYFRVQRYPEAIEAFNSVLSSDANFSELASVYLELAFAYYNTKEYKLAWKYIREIQKSGGNVPAEFIEKLRKVSPN
jgi:tetratricopeptide (TPR) repeat protein